MILIVGTHVNQQLRANSHILLVSGCEDYLGIINTLWSLVCILWGGEMPTMLGGKLEGHRSGCGMHTRGHEKRVCWTGWLGVN